MKKRSGTSSETETVETENFIHYDKRYPVFNGFWKRSIPGQDKDISMDEFDEPHVKRRLTILDKYPQIKNYYGIESSTIPITFVATGIQLALAWYFGRNEAPTWLFLLVSYVIGGSITSLYGVIIHEATHGLCSTSPLVNRMIGFTANICIPFPIFSSFRRYHLDHHAFQGVQGKDPDLPLKWEIYFVRGNFFMKLLFMFCYPAMYVIRGIALQKVPSSWEIANLLFTLTTDTLIYKVCGVKGLLYIFCSLWFGYGLHPGAAHFIQEHFTFDDGQETYSYYGRLNSLFLNIGYHNEHHDFAQVPWSKLPLVKETAAEFYEPLKAHYSWIGVLYHFLTDPTLGPQSRVGRSTQVHKQGRKMVIEARKNFERSDSKILL